MSRTNPLKELSRFGVSVWIDNISRELLESGELARLIREDGVCGLTSNPTIFANALASSQHYDEAVRRLAAQHPEPQALFEALAVEDIRAAADLLRGVYDETAGRDGYASIELPPELSQNSPESHAQAVRLNKLVGRPNVMIKIPGTGEGVPAILASMRDGLNINITLLFTVGQYEAVADAYLEALEYRLQRDLTIRAISSVASIFVSRVDTFVDAALDKRIDNAADEADRRRLESLKGRAGVANAKVVYERFRSYLGGRDWQLIAASGAKVQRLLWASTGVKDPAYPDLLYAEELIGGHTVNTMPEETLKAFVDHGTAARTADRHVEEAHRTLRELSRLGIDMEHVGEQLQAKGVDLFSEAWGRAIDVVEAKRRQMLGLGQEVAS